MGNKETVYIIVSRIPRGKVATYGDIARLSGIKNSRVVGNYLHENSDSEKVPCHRVVNREGEVSKSYAFGGKQQQIERLLTEGVEISSEKVNLNKHLWRPGKF